MLPWGSTRSTLERQDENEPPPRRFSPLPLTNFPNIHILDYTTVTTTTTVSNLPILVCSSFRALPTFQLHSTDARFSWTILVSLVCCSKTNLLHSLPLSSSVFVSVSTSGCRLGSRISPWATVLRVVHLPNPDATSLPKRTNSAKSTGRDTICSRSRAGKTNAGTSRGKLQRHASNPHSWNRHIIGESGGVSSVTEAPEANTNLASVPTRSSHVMGVK